MAQEQLNVLPLITSSRAFLSTEQRIVDYILANQATASQLTCAQLASASGTSEASVSRFAKRLGFRNYRAFQFALARDVAVKRGEAQVTREVSLDDIEQSLVNIRHAKQKEIAATIDGLDRDAIRTAVRLLAGADLILFAAVGNTNAVAIDASIKFGQLGLRSVATTITESSTSLALTMHQGDVLVLISNSGKSKRLMDILRAARGAHATILLITGNVDSPLAHEADLVMQTVNYEALLTTGDFTFSKISATLIIEVLYSFLLPEIPHARDAISSYEELIQRDKEVE